MEESSEKHIGSQSKSIGAPPRIQAPGVPSSLFRGIFKSDKSEGFHFSRCDLILVLLLFLVSFSAVIFSGKGYGLSWDEAYYYEPSRTAANWLKQVIFSSDRPVSSAEISASWEKISELPAVVKISLGASSLLLEKFIGPLASFRLPSALAFSLTLVLIYAIMARPYGRAPAVFASLAYGFMPRIFAHAHIAASEAITVFISLLVVFCFLKGLKSSRWSLVLAVVFGLALNTRIHCFFLPFILLPWAHLYHRSRYVNNFFAMVFLSPVVWIATWPWLWHDTAARILQYVYFFAQHQYTALYYFGQKYNYGSNLAPWHYPLVQTLLTIPPITLVFILIGTGSAFYKARKKPLLVLFLWGAFFTLLVSSLPSSPKYDGIRLFITSFVFLSLVSGAGFALVSRTCFSMIQKYSSRIPPLAGVKNAPIRCKAIVSFICLFLLLAGGTWAIIRSHPYSLSYYNIFIGGISGAFKKGLETTYWGEAVNNRVLRELNALPKGARIKTLALHEKVFTLHKQWGKLRSDLQINPDPPPFDYHILLVRKGFFARPEWRLYSKWRRLKVFRFHDVPLVILFKTGEEFEKQWRGFSIQKEARTR